MINDTAGKDGLVPTLLVCGAYPRMVDLDPPNPTIAQRAATVRRAMEEVKELRATQQVRDALHMRNGPNASPLHDLPLNSKVLVYRGAKQGC